MKLFKPQVQLFKTITLDGPDHFYLHVVTNTDVTNYREDGFEVGTIVDNKLVVVVRAIPDQSIPDLFAETPVVHTIDLGVLDFPAGEGDIEVIFDRGDRDGNDDNKTTVNTTDAVEDSRPIPSNSL